MSKYPTSINNTDMGILLTEVAPKETPVGKLKVTWYVLLPLILILIFKPISVFKPCPIPLKNVKFL